MQTTLLLLSEEDSERLDIMPFVVNMAIQYCNQNSLVVDEEKNLTINFGNIRDKVGLLPDSKEA